MKVALNPGGEEPQKRGSRPKWKPPDARASAYFDTGYIDDIKCATQRKFWLVLRWLNTRNVPNLTYSSIGQFQ